MLWQRGAGLFQGIREICVCQSGSACIAAVHAKDGDDIGIHPYVYSNGSIDHSGV